VAAGGDDPDHDQDHADENGGTALVRVAELV
jgi:hypothetical protein